MEADMTHFIKLSEHLFSFLFFLFIFSGAPHSEMVITHFWHHSHQVTLLKASSISIRRFLFLFTTSCSLFCTSYYLIIN